MATNKLVSLCEYRRSIGNSQECGAGGELNISDPENWHRALRIVSQSTVCPECDGEGETYYEYTVGGYTENGPWQSYRTCRCVCENCYGSGEVALDEED